MTVRRTIATLAAVAALGASLLMGVNPPAASGGVLPYRNFSASLTGAQEVPPSATSATGTGTVVLSPDETTIYVMVTFQGLTGPAIDAHIHQAPPGMDGGVVFPLSFPSATATSVPITGTFAVTFAQVTELKLGNWYFNIHSGNFPGGEIRGQILGTFDRLTQIGVFRPSSASWIVAGGPSTVWGTSTDIDVPGDYNGDVRLDAAVFRPSTGTWFVQGGAATNWGTSGDIPVPAGYDGNFTTDVAVFRPSTGTWYVQGGATTNWGTPGDIPVPADYDGNGTVDVAVFRPSTGTWYVHGGLTMAWGTSGDIPVPGDYDDNGSADVAVFRPSTGAWYVQAGKGATSTTWGTTGDIPVPGDYDGDGRDTVAVFRPSTGIWYVQGGPTANWGASGDKPLPLPYAIRQAFF